MQRRDFLRSALASSALYAWGGLPFLANVASGAGFAQVSNRVLVNLMLVGGPDFRHLFPPPFDSNTASYGYQYWQAKAASHAIANAVSAYQARWNDDYFAVSDGVTEFGILKSCGWLKDMWDQGKVAVICNAIGCTARDHAYCQLVMDQGDVTSQPNDTEKAGWGGRLASAAGGNVVALTTAPRRFCYGPKAGEPNGHDNSNLVAARNTRAFSLYEPDTSVALVDQKAVMARALRSYYAAKRQDIEVASPYSRFIEHESTLRQFGQLIDDRLSTVPIPPLIAALYQGALNSVYFGEQIRNLYDAFASNDILSLRVASMEYSSWDSHKNQRDLIEPKLLDLFGYGKAFDVLYQELPQDAVDNTVFVIAGEFGRQLKANGGNGTDHGKGNVMLVIGNSVNGGIYGDMFPQSELARLDVPGADINGLTELDHVFGAVCDWVSTGSGDVVFPRRSIAPIEPEVSFSGLFS